MSALAADTPVKPSRPAMIEITRKIKAHFSNDTGQLLLKSSHERTRFQLLSSVHEIARSQELVIGFRNGNGGNVAAWLALALGKLGQLPF